MAGLLTGLVAGAAAGAAGTTALNAATYLDMAVRGRPASSTPEQTVERAAERAGLTIPGEGEARENRVAGLGPLQGILAGVGTGAAVGAARALGVRLPFGVAALATGGAAMLAADGAMTALGVTDPRTWGLSGWLSDAVPHAVFGAVTVAVLRALDR